MKINFQNSEVNSGSISVGFSAQSGDVVKSEATNKYSGSIKNGIRIDVGNNRLSDPNGEQTKAKKLSEIQSELGAIDTDVAKDYRVVMSNTLSAKDYAKAEEEGFKYSEIDPEDIVTIQDKVKAELAMSGVVITGYNDDCDSAVFEEAVGNGEIAKTIIKEFTDANLPLTKENADEISKAWNLASDLEIPNEKSLVYMLDNDLKPTIWNFYLSKNIGSNADVTNFYKEDLFNNRIDLSASENEKIVEQIKDISKSINTVNGILTEEEALADAQWLLDRKLPVTADSIANFEAIKAVDFPISEEVFSKAVTSNLQIGEMPINADLSVQENIYEKAADIAKYYFSEDIEKMTEENLSVRRALEEVRLSMTAEVNLKLLKSGFALDTAPMEELIDALKTAEETLAERYFGEYSDSKEAAISSYRLMNQTNNIVSELEASPVQTIGIFTSRSFANVTLSEYHKEAITRRDVYIKANESYESLMTMPRSDLGDKINKAFENADELIKNIGLELNDGNRRAVRILGYNAMEITEENVELIAKASEQVENIVRKMTPASVLKMIRDNINPLESSFEELNQYFEQSDNSYEKVSTDFADFLYGIERQNGITDDERKSFIGIYRMIHQIEKNDSASIGAVINERAELDFKNLISAVRSNKFVGFDIAVDEEFGGIDQIVKVAETITDQIATAFKADRNLEDLRNLRNTDNHTNEIISTLRDNDIIPSADNVNALSSLRSANENLYEEISSFEDSNIQKDYGLNLSDIVNDFENTYATNFDESLATFDEKIVKLTEVLTENAESYLDVKALSLLHRQLKISSQINRKTDGNPNKDYIVPFDTGNGIAKIHLAFRQGEESAKAGLNINTVMGETAVEAHFYFSNNKLEGYFVGNNDDELKKMEKISDIFVESLKEDKSLSELDIQDIRVLGREGDAKPDDEYYHSKDANGSYSEGAERSVLLQISKMFLQSVSRA